MFTFEAARGLQEKFVKFYETGKIACGLWRGFATRDGNLLTGQHNFSGSETAELVVRALGG